MPIVAPKVKVVRVRQQNVIPGPISFLSTNVARVDPAGNDSTGTIGDLTKPFKTVQAAINAFQSNPVPGGFIPVIDVGTMDNTAEDVTTSLPALIFHAVSGPEWSAPFASLTATASAFTLELHDTRAGAIVAHCSGGILIKAADGAQIQDVSNDVGPINIAAEYDGALIGGTISAPGNNITISNFSNTDNIPTIDSAGSLIELNNSRVQEITQADNNVILNDSRVQTNNSAANTSYGDFMLNPAKMDFSQFPTTEPGDFVHAWINGAFVNAPGYTIPTSDPHVIGQIWCDTTAGFVVKVSQG